MTYSEIEIEFLNNFEPDFRLDIVYNIAGATSGYTFNFKGMRSQAFEVTASGTPEGTATSFKTAFDLDTTDYVTAVTGATILIQSETESEDFIGFSARNASDVLLVNGVDYNVTFNNFEDVVTVANVDVALVRSPHYVSTNFNLSTTTKATIDVKVWDGLLDTPPAESTYTLTRIRPTADAIDLDTNLSEIIRSQLKPKVPTFALNTAEQVVSSEGNSVKWIQYVASFTDIQNNIPNIEGTFAALDGFGYHSENANPSTPANKILLSNIENRQVARNGIVLIPFVNDGEVELVSRSGGNIFNIVDTLDSKDYVQYFILNVNELPSSNQLQIKIVYNILDRLDFSIKITDECKFTPHNIIFKNKYGVFESVSMFKRSTSSIDVKKEEFVNKFTTNKTYDVTTHQFRDINFEATEKISLNSGYVSEAENETFKQMLLSDQVYFYKNGNLIPVNITSNSLTFKDELSDKLINYTMEFKYSYNTIQNV